MPRQSNDITPEEIEALTEGLRRAHRALGSWHVVGRRLLAKSGAYASRVANEPQFTPSAQAVYHWREFWLGLPRRRWESTPELKEKAWAIISERWGPENAISVKQLAFLLSVDPRRARGTVRALRKDGYPICTVLSPKGSYFRPRTLEEYRHWRNRTLWSRAADIIDTCGAQEMHEAKWFPQDDSVRPSLEWEKRDVKTQSAPVTATD